ncbi:MAG: flagellar protein FlgJ [Pseudomonadales bacterium]|jgi:flagellar protein FlgJ
MAGITSPGSDISALIQIQGSTANNDAIRSLKALQSVGANTQLSSNNTDSASDTAASKKALKTAREFESLLIHSMLKNMRKTTMAENTSNQKAMYDDMLDKQLADTMAKGGGLGVAEQLLTQLDANSAARNVQSETTQDRLRLRALMSTENTPSRQLSADAVNPQNAVTSIRKASLLWGNTNGIDESKSLQQRFTEPLETHARRSAEKLGTTPNAVLAIAALETGWGRHVLKNTEGESTNNYFGIKATGNDSGYSENPTREFLDGSWQKVEAKFKTYDNVEESINGFTNFILENPRYAKAIEHAEDPERFLKEIHKAGYATDPQYAEKAISILHQINMMTARL